MHSVEESTRGHTCITPSFFMYPMYLRLQIDHGLNDPSTSEYGRAFLFALRNFTKLGNTYTELEHLKGLIHPFCTVATSEVPSEVDLAASLLAEIIFFRNSRPLHKSIASILLQPIRGVGDGDPISDANTSIVKQAVAGVIAKYAALGVATSSPIGHHHHPPSNSASGEPEKLDDVVIPQPTSLLLFEIPNSFASNPYIRDWFGPSTCSLLLYMTRVVHSTLGGSSSSSSSLSFRSHQRHSSPFPRWSSSHPRSTSPPRPHPSP